jgi:tRNA modification GTPase
MSTDTIYALASGIGRAGVAVIRVSGPHAHKSLEALCGKKNFTPRASSLSNLKNPANGQTLDQALVIPFNAPASYTGEDVVEYHLHGGRAVIDSVLAVLAKQPAHRMAEPGEFTRRAFLNGKMDCQPINSPSGVSSIQILKHSFWLSIFCRKKSL